MKLIRSIWKTYKVTICFVGILVILAISIEASFLLTKYDEPKNVCEKGSFMWLDEECFIKSPIELYALFFIIVGVPASIVIILIR